MKVKALIITIILNYLNLVFAQSQLNNTQDKNNPRLNLKIKKVPVISWKGK